jgi:pimeloyl-ACP methyl ester carboxylesterase
VAATLAASDADRIRRLALLDPSLALPPEQVLRYVEIDRQDWAFATREGALNALLASERILTAPRETLAAFVADDVRAGDDGLFRFSYHPGSVVVGWSEAAREPPPVAPLPTLLVRPAASFVDGRKQDSRYRLALGSALTFKGVPNGHNVLWESPLETASASQSFVSSELSCGLTRR